MGWFNHQPVCVLFVLYVRTFAVYLHTITCFSGKWPIASLQDALPTYNSHNIFMKKKLAVSSWYSTSPTSWSVPSRELTYPPDVWHFWVDDFPNFPRWDMLVSWRVYFCHSNWSLYDDVYKAGIFQFKSLKVAIGELEIMAVHQLLSRDGIGTIFRNLVLAGSIPIGSMYGIFTYIYLKNQPNVVRYAIHESHGIFCLQKNIGAFPEQKRCLRNLQEAEPNECYLVVDAGIASWRGGAATPHGTHEWCWGGHQEKLLLLGHNTIGKPNTNPQNI